MIFKLSFKTKNIIIGDNAIKVININPARYLIFFFEKNSFKKLNFLCDNSSSWTQTPIALVISVISIENIMIVNLVAISLLIK